MLLVMPYGSCSHKAKMAGESCLSLFDDDELRLVELFGDNHFEELLADSLCETETTENYSKTLRPTAGKPN